MGGWISFSGSHYKYHTTVPTATLPFSFAGWWYYDGAVTVDEYIIGIYDTALDDNCAAMYIDPTNDTVAAKWKTVEYAHPTSGPLTAGWWHVAVVFAGIASRKVYFGGTGSAEDTTSSSALTGMDRITIGRYDGATPGSYLSAALAELAMWDVALTGPEVYWLSLGVPPPLIKSDSIIRYWPGRTDDSSGPISELIAGEHLSSGSASFFIQQDHGPPVTYPAPAYSNMFTGPTLEGGVGPFPTYRARAL